MSIGTGIAGTKPTYPRLGRLFAGSDLADWALCFFSYVALLSSSWMAAHFPGGGTAAIFLFMLPWAWIAARNFSATIGSLLSNWPVLALPLFALLSTTWSTLPQWTLRASIQYLVTAIIGVLLGSCIKPRTMLWALFSAGVVITVVGVLAGGVEQLPGGQVALVGLFASKNAFGSVVALMLFTATVLAFDKSQPLMARMIALAVALVAPIFLVLSRSTGALVCAIAALTIAGALALIVRFSPQVRFAALLLVVLLAAALLIVWQGFGDSAAVLTFLGKDVTLTGRTWLWEWANKAIQENPLLGVGYQAYWQPGNWGAEEIWLHDAKPEKTGYHFHNLILQVSVDLGYIGLSILLVTLVAISARIGQYLLFARAQAEQIFAIAFFVYLLLRVTIEVELTWQFEMPTILFSVIWIYLGPQRRRFGKPRASVQLKRSALHLQHTALGNQGTSAIGR